MPEWRVTLHLYVRMTVRADVGRTRCLPAKKIRSFGFGESIQRSQVQRGLRHQHNSGLHRLTGGFYLQFVHY